MPIPTLSNFNLCIDRLKMFDKNLNTCKTNVEIQGPPALAECVAAVSVTLAGDFETGHK